MFPKFFHYSSSFLLKADETLSTARLPAAAPADEPAEEEPEA